MNTRPVNEQEFGLFIRQHLNAGSAALGKPVTDRIYEARRAALARHAELQSQRAVASFGHSVLVWGRDNLQPFVLALCVVAALAASNYLMSLEHVSELEEVDSALLADDLPINAYLDKGFDTWLSSSPQQP